MKLLPLLLFFFLLCPLAIADDPDISLTIDAPSSVKIGDTFTITFNLNHNNIDIGAWRLYYLTFSNCDLITHNITDDWKPNEFHDISQNENLSLTAQTFIMYNETNHPSLPQEIYYATFKATSKGTATFSYSFKCADYPETFYWSKKNTFTISIEGEDAQGGSPPPLPPPTNTPPIALFTIPNIAYVNETITFNANKSYDPDGTISSYSWYITPTNETFTSMSFNKAFNNPGTYNISLTVTDNHATTNTLTKTLQVITEPTEEENKVLNPIITFENKTYYVNDTVNFSSHKSTGNITFIHWEFGNGVAVDNLTSVKHSYSESGNYTITLTISNTTATTFTTATITIYDYQKDPVVTDPEPINDDILVGILVLFVGISIFIGIFYFFKQKNL